MDKESILVGPCEGCNGQYTQKERNSDGQLECFICHTVFVPNLSH